MQSIDPGGHERNRPGVLIADNDKAARLILQKWLHAWGYEVVLAKDGIEAWEILRDERSPNLIILDRKLPGLDGIALCRQIRELSHGRHCYVLMTTSRNSRQGLVRALESGANECLAKPLNKAELKARLMAASRTQDELIDACKQHLDQATKDGLTGLWNRTTFLDLFQRELDRSQRRHEHTGLLLLDVDHFKSVNDTYGHLIGDSVLQEVARRLKKSVRSYDFVGRYGGEEFLVAFPACDRSQIRRRAEDIRRAVASQPFQACNVEIPITISIGAVAGSGSAGSALELVSVADAALYRAKDSGRNRTVECLKSPREILQSPGALRERCARCKHSGSAACIAQGKDVTPVYVLPHGLLKVEKKSA